MTPIILHVLSMVVAVCCLSVHRPMQMPVRLDPYRGRLTDDEAEASEPPFEKVRELADRVHRVNPRQKRQDMSEMDTYNLSNFCRAARIDWPQCKLFQFTSNSQRSKLDETISNENLERVIHNEVKDGTLGDEMDHLRNLGPTILKDVMGDKFDARFTRPATRQKRETSASETIIGDPLTWDPKDHTGVDILLSADQYEKRMHRFNSWGGKRSDGDYVDPSLEKRSVPFSSWGGKRESSLVSWTGETLPAFSAWGGKRGQAFSSWGGKRSPAFSSWGGKRNPAFSAWGGKRGAAFSSWGGKRDNSLVDEEEKRAAKFSSWGGKRNPPFTTWDETVTVNESSDKLFDGKDGVYPEKVIRVADSGSSPTISSTTDIDIGERERGDEELESVEKRTTFSNWGGKRTSETVKPICDTDEEGAERVTMAKRDVHFSPWGGKRRQSIVPEGYNLFANWVSKRGRSRGKQTSSTPLRQNRRGADFYPWGGKRSSFPLF